MATSMQVGGFGFVVGLIVALSGHTTLGDERQRVPRPFSPRSPYAFAGSIESGFVTADFDGDAATDLVAVDVFAGRIAAVSYELGEYCLLSEHSAELTAPPAVASADVDGDGDGDIVFVSRFRLEDGTSENRLMVLENRNGTFPEEPRSVIRGESVASALTLTTTDVDSDGIADVVLSRRNRDGVIFFGSAERSFDRTGSVRSPDCCPRSVRAADVDRDGDDDLIVVGGGAEFFVVENDRGVLSRFRRVAVPESRSLVGGALFAGDLDRDLAPDVVVIGDRIGGGRDVIRFTNVRGEFVVTSRNPIDAFPRAVTAADLDGDDRAEIIVAATDVTWVSWGAEAEAGDPLRRFAPGAMDVHASDIDRDGDTDVLLAAGTVESILVLENPGDGSFTDVAVPGPLDRAESLDFDADGLVDVVSSGDRIVLFRNLGDGVLAPILLRDQRSDALAVADLDGDGRVEIVLEDGVLWGGDEPPLTTFTPFSDVGLVDAIASARFAGRASLGLALLSGDGVVIVDVERRALRNAGRFAAIPAPVATDARHYPRPRDLVAADFDGDGLVDLALGGTIAPCSVSLLFGQGDGTFSLPRCPDVDGLSVLGQNTAVGARLVAVDVDGNGTVDLGYAGPGPHPTAASSGFVAILSNDGGGEFSVRFAVGGTGPESQPTLATGDLDGDGSLDLVVSGDPPRYSASFRAYLGDGTGCFTASARLGGARTRSSALAVADFDGDGRDEIWAVTGSNASTFEIDADTFAAGFGSCEANSFRRGDANADAAIDLADALATLQYLFAGGERPICAKSADVDDSGGIGITDPIVLLNFLFADGPAPADPFERCGKDPTPDSIDCAQSTPCA